MDKHAKVTAAPRAAVLLGLAGGSLDDVLMHPAPRSQRVLKQRVGRGIGHDRPAGSKLARMAAEGRCAKWQPR